MARRPAAGTCSGCTCCMLWRRAVHTERWIASACFGIGQAGWLACHAARPCSFNFICILRCVRAKVGLDGCCAGMVVRRKERVQSGIVLGAASSAFPLRCAWRAVCADVMVGWCKSDMSREQLRVLCWCGLCIQPMYCHHLLCMRACVHACAGRQMWCRVMYGEKLCVLSPNLFERQPWCHGGGNQAACCTSWHAASGATSGGSWQVSWRCSCNLSCIPCGAALCCVAAWRLHFGVGGVSCRRQQGSPPECL